MRSPESRAAGSPPTHGRAARRAAIEILARVENGAWSDRLLQTHESRLDDRRDRGLLHVLVLECLRWQGAADARLAPWVRGGLERLDPPVRALLRIAVVEGARLARPTPIAVDIAVGLAREVAGEGASRLVNAVLRRALAPGAPVLDVKATLPGWLFERWRQEYGEAATARMAARLCEPAHPFLVAAASVDRDALAREVAEAGVTTTPSTLDPRGLSVTGGVPQATPAFARGAFTLIDEGAALVARLAAPGPGDERPIIDLAAAPGGKTAALSAAHPQHRIVALELVASRARALAGTIARTHADERVLAVRADARNAPVAPECASVVLLDAPCSGTGTLRRRPERRWRVSEADIAKAAALQRALLGEAAALVGPRGALVYAVCSLEPEEGRHVIADFLATHPGFRIEDPRETLAELDERFIADDPLRLVTRPDLAETEGFVAARFRRCEEAPGQG